MKLFGLVGYPLSHSFSPQYFREKFRKEHIDAVYRPFQIVRVEEFPSLLSAYPRLHGLNVTIPYKEKIMAYLDSVDALAEDIGAVNCIRFGRGELKGYNTDAAGFRDSIIPLLQSHHKAALILGTGGASRAVIHVFREAGIQCLGVSRQPGRACISYRELDRNILEQYPVIVNTTPLGMYPDEQSAPPIPYNFLTPRHLLYDVIYNPAETRFLREGKQRGAITQNGYDMLVGQAEASWNIWNLPADDE